MSVHKLNPLIAFREPYTDSANADRFIERQFNQVRYCEAWKSWLIYDGKRWVRDRMLQVWELGRATVISMYLDAAELMSEHERKALVKHAMKSESEQGIRAMVNLARSNPLLAVRPEQFDLEPYLLNVENGVVDLRTGELLDHDPNRLITKLAPVHYNPEATHPVLDRILLRLDDTLCEYLQLAFGSTLTGDTSNELLYFVYGDTKSGKSSLLGAFKACLGSYAVTANFDTFLRKTRLRRALSADWMD